MRSNLNSNQYSYEIKEIYTAIESVNVYLLRFKNCLQIKSINWNESSISFKIKDLTE